MGLLGSDTETSSQELTMEASIIFRGKRTKRSRPSTVVTSSSSTSGGERGLDSDAYFPIPSPQSYGNSDSTQEDEDMANCLMLLAQSGSRKEEFYAYECKTCNRSFTSFQALGGHRASHKKPKTILNDKEDQEHVDFKRTSPLISQQRAKVHECSICGSEFSSGQALGGHMRRHRIPTANTSSTMSSITDHDDQKPRNHVLQLDLNLPAPEDDHYDSKFQFVFSSPALVDCHY